MITSRPPYQLELDLGVPGRGEAPCRDAQEVEAVTATAEPESPASTEHLMEAICDPDNLEAALDAVVRNKGAPGIDGITVKQLPGILKARWPEIAGRRSKNNCCRGATSRNRCVGWESRSRPAGRAISAYQLRLIV
jgi:hypothetical protein